MNTNQRNLIYVELVADALAELLDEIIFVGGSTTLLLVDSVVVSGVRQTEDVDVIVDVATAAEYQRLGKRLRKAGFQEDQQGPICRWKMKSGEFELKLDVMPNSKEILGFSNRWYPDAMRTANEVTLSSGTTIRVVNPGYFLATKFEAFLGRGQGDYFSHDLEDIVFVMENRTDLVKELYDYPQELKEYLAAQASELLNDDFLNVLPGLVAISGAEMDVENSLRLIARCTD